MNFKSIGTKLTVLICAMLIFSISIVVFSTIILSSNHSSELMQQQSSSSLKTLKYEVNAQLGHLENAYDTLVASNSLVTAINDGDTSALKSEWSKLAATDHDYIAVFGASGNTVWSSEGYVSSDYDTSTSVTSGVTADSDGGISIRYITPINADGSKIGTAVIGMNLSEVDYLDEIKELTGAQVTIFNGKTRYATTVVGADGNRAIGTDMAANVEKQVITGGKVYQGEADILGENHFVEYEPMTDIGGKIVGAYFAGFSSAENDKSFATMILIAVGIAVVAAAASGVIAFTIIRKSVTMPIAIAEDLAKNMSAGNLNIPDPEFKFADDEIGRFVKNLENTKYTLNSYISDISRILSDMANGNFNSTTSVNYIGDFTEIKTSFERINDTLRSIISNMNSSADDVMTGANQIADGSQVLAEGTTRQATAIDELSASIDNISSKVQSTAKNAEEANDLSQHSHTKISQQNTEIQTMLDAMEEIRTKSVEIGQIIKTIDDIAFQTNILALNAAVEAARAGDAGKGFAVVADEVRNLAAKSAEAASRTNDLISATGEAVANGVEIAKHTAETMKEVMDYSHKTDVLIKEIASAASDQAEAVGQVTIGIGRIADVVQQNSATAEETAASCEELSGQSRMLKEQVELLKA